MLAKRGGLCLPEHLAFRRRLEGSPPLEIMINKPPDEKQKAKPKPLKGAKKQQIRDFIFKRGFISDFTFQNRSVVLQRSDSLYLRCTLRVSNWGSITS